MKKYKTNQFKALLLAAITIFGGSTLGCQRKHQASGGTVIGNGIIRYHDKTYDYFFEYPKDLEFKRISESIIRLDNNKFSANNSSKITFSIINVAEPSANTLESYAAQFSASNDWRSTDSANIKGLYYRRQSADRLDARYIYQISKETLLDVRADASTVGNGIALISTVIASIDFDTTSPVIHEVTFEPAVAKAGQTVKLKFRATDNMGTILGRSPTGSVSIRIDETCRTLMDESWDGVESCSNLKAVGSDWYEYEIQTNARMKDGKYLLHPMTIWDSAGNPLELLPDYERGVYRSNNPEDQTLIPLAYLQVTNSDADTEAPKLTNVRFEPAFLTAGEESKLVFEATDNDPNFAPNKFCEKARHRDWFKFSRTDIPSTPDIDPVEYAVSACSEPVKREDGDWEVRLTSEKGLPPGEYVMEFGVNDSVKNLSNTVSVSLFITNSGKIDLEGPKVLSIKTDRAIYKRGETGKILIQVKDDISGIKDQANDAVTKFCRKGFVPRKRPSSDVNATTRILVCDNSLKHVEGDWYSTEFKLAENVPTGTYILPEIQISDRVGNSTILTTSGQTADDPLYQIKHSERTTQLSILSLEIQD
jgi:hypothetical protein